MRSIRRSALFIAIAVFGLGFNLASADHHEGEGGFSLQALADGHHRSDA